MQEREKVSVHEAQGESQARGIRHVIELSNPLILRKCLRQSFKVLRQLLEERRVGACKLARQMSAWEAQIETRNSKPEAQA